MPPDAPIDREDVLDAIEDALEEGAFEDALTMCDLLLVRDPQDPDALVLRGQILADCGQLEAALAHYQRAHALVPTWDDAEVMQASVLLELGRLDEASTLTEVALARAPDRPDAHRTRAIVFELQGNDLGAERHYRRARDLDSSFHVPFRVTDELFAELAERCLSSFPAEFTAVFQNVEIRLRDLPSAEEVGDPNSPMSMLVLGYFDGTPRSLRSTEDPFSDMPSHVFLFKRNHERICTSLAELTEQIDITLKHELGHFMGLDEDDMERLGLD